MCRNNALFIEKDFDSKGRKRKTKKKHGFSLEQHTKTIRLNFCTIKTDISFVF